LLDLTEEDIDLYEDYAAMEAAESLWAFRQYIDPAFIKGWFPKDLSYHLQIFMDDFVAGRRPKLVIEAPPQHGKSRGLHDFIAYLLGRLPDTKVIYASFSDDLGVIANMYLQRILDDREKYGRVFPKTRLNSSNLVTKVAGASRFLRNSSLLEIVDHKGSFRNTTVQGQINGKGLDLGIIDDPLKGRREAQSLQTRNNTWMWLSDDFFTRFSEYAGMIILATRWHVDDPTGRFLLQFPEAKVLKYPGLYRRPTPDRETGKLPRNAVIDPRRVGDPLFPEFKSKEFLMERKKNSTQASWESLYQQSPIVAGGGMFPVNCVRYAQNQPAKEHVKKSVRYWDKAGTEDGGAYTAGTLMHLLKDGRYYIGDVIRVQWSSWDRENYIKATAHMDRTLWGRVETWVEQEPGSGGKESAERTIAMLAGFPVRADKVTGDKETRAEPYAAQWQGGNIILHGNPRWNIPFVDEHESFPAGQYKDQVDSAAGAFMKLITKAYKYDGSLKWVG
jgi:predicted phage terminase large subunit-like protein